MIYQSQIMETEAFQAIVGDVAKKVTLSKATCEKINHGFEMTKNVGFDRWIEVDKPSEIVQKIVKELINKNQ